MEANKAFETADHLTYVTYPLVNDLKLLLHIVDQLNLALSKGMDALLYYDYIYKRISNIPNDFNRKLDIFKNHTSRRYGISRETIVLISDVAEIINKRKEAPMEFSRKDKYVIAYENYRLKTITLDKVKSYLNEGKGFVKKLNEVLEASDRRFG